MIAALSTAFDPGAFLTGMLSLIKGTLGPIFAGMTANLAPTQGPAAPAEAAGITAAVDAAAIGMSKLDTGAWEIPNTMTAQLHTGEMVVPAEPAAALRNYAQGNGSSAAPGAGGGGPVFHFNGPVIGTQAFVNSMIPQIAKALQQYGNRNPSQGW